MFLHVQFAESGLLLVEGLFVGVAHGLPAGAQDLGDVGVVHVWAGLQNGTTLLAGPHHEGIHRPLDVGPAGLGLLPLGADDFGAEKFTCEKRSPVNVYVVSVLFDIFGLQ